MTTKGHPLHYLASQPNKVLLHTSKWSKKSHFVFQRESYELEQQEHEQMTAFSYLSVLFLQNW